MLPTLAPGDFLVAVERAELTRGCIVVVEHPTRPGYEMAKRLTGVPGDEMEGRTLGPAEYWVVGDRFDGSTDSRQFGPVGRRKIRGVVRFRYWPPSRVGYLGRGPEGSVARGVAAGRGRGRRSGSRRTTASGFGVAR